MKKFISLLIIISLSVLILAGCTRVGSSMNGSGKIVDKDLKVDGFSSLNIKGPFVVEVIQSKDYTVTLSVDENLLNRVKVSLERKTLNLSIEAPATFFPTSLKLKITLPELETLTLSDAANAAVNGFTSTKTFTVFLSGKSKLSCSSALANLELDISGASEAVFVGKAQNTKVEARGASKLNLAEFESSSAQIHLNEGSEATMNVIAWVDITLENGSKFFYVGNPIFRDTTISGGSSMAHK